MLHLKKYLSFFLVLMAFNSFAQESKLIEAYSTEYVQQLKKSDVEAYSYQIYLAEHSAYLLELPSDKTANYMVVDKIELKKGGFIKSKDINPSNFNPLLYNLEPYKQQGAVKLQGSVYTISVVNDRRLQERYSGFKK